MPKNDNSPTPPEENNNDQSKEFKIKKIASDKEELKPEKEEPEIKAEEKKENPPLQLFDSNQKDREISEEMEESYLDYAMSVIVSRALPDVRDGLKPVHRRILYAMNELGLKASAKYLKSARVVGDVLGKYHPHGDTAVYDSMTRMAQEFALRYPLVHGQGNFGSIDGDRPAAMRYTEVKMQKITEEMLTDIDKETIPWADNYDGTRKEPVVLPSKIPNLLLNGTMGIAVGMATNIPPHNLGELIDALIQLADNPNTTIEEILEHIKGPDFPTGGIIYDKEAIKNMYSTGRGKIIVRGKAEIVERKNDRFSIIINEIPYQVNKADLVTKIAELAQDKKIKGISDIRDESNKDGIRVVIELKKEAYPNKLLNQLYKYTALQESFHLNMIALIDGIQPRLLNLKEVLEHFLHHRRVVITNRCKYELRVAQERAHILEGLKIALDNIDEVIATIRKSATKEDAHAALMKKFKLSDLQAQAILEMRLQTLAGLERKKIENEYQEKLAEIARLEDLLAHPKKITQIIKDELAEIKDKYADPRKTKVIKSALGEISTKDTIPNEPMIIMLSQENYIKRVPPCSFRSQHRGGKGIIGSTTKEEDEIRQIIHASNHDEIFFFTNFGRVFRAVVYELPQATRTAKGQPVVNFLQLKNDEKITAMLPLINQKFSCKNLIMATHKGMIKKTATEEFHNVRQSGLIAIRLRPGDSLEWVREINPKSEVMIVSQNGKGIRFNEEDVRPVGRASIGVRGIRLKGEDHVVEMDISDNPENRLFIITQHGLGKCSQIKNYRYQARGGSGVKTANITQKTGLIVGAKVLTPATKGDLIIVSKHGQIIRLPVKDIPCQGRATQGVYLMRMHEDDWVASVSLIDEEEKIATPPEKPEEKQKTLV